MNRAVVRAGFALPEVLLAVLLFAIGILALASTATAIVAQAEDARASADAAMLAGSALDSLRAVSCAALSDGATTRGRSSVRWSVSSGTRSVAVRTTLVLGTRRGPRVVTMDSLLPCDR